MCLYFLAWVDSLVGDSTTSFDTLGKVSARIGAVNSCFEASTAKDVLAIIVASDALGSVRVSYRSRQMQHSSPPGKSAPNSREMYAALTVLRLGYLRGGGIVCRCYQSPETAYSMTVSQRRGRKLTVGSSPA
jgi:hypothetical protein